jgi:hypothetical protein
MHVLPFKIAAALAGLTAAVALSIPMTGQADAATTKVQIVQTAKPNVSNTQEISLSVVPSTSAVIALKKSSPGNPGQTWIKRDIASNFATYENVKLPGMCLEVRTINSGAPLMVGPCSTFLARQRWTQGFTGGAFRKLQNLDSGHVATFESPGITGNVKQRFDQGLKAQQWSVRPV